jgi:hypothetical protein
MRGRIGFVAAFVAVIGLVAGGAAGASVAAAPKGFKTVTVEDAGFSMAIPKPWVTLDLTAEDAEELIEQAREEFPALADFLSGDVAEYAAQNVVLLAADKNATDFTTNVNVIHLDEVTEAPTIDDIASQVETLDPDAEVREVTIDGQPGVRADYELSRGSLEASLTQLAVSGPEGGLLITFTASQDDPQTVRINKMIKSLKLLD